MTKSAVKDVLIAIAILILVVGTLWYQHKLKADATENVSITYYKPVGGEDRRVQEVKLSCYSGASKGAPNSNMWCYETVLEEWTE